MGITTKAGDQGRTGLYKGKRVAKDSLRIEFNGVLDELSSFLGLALSHIRREKLKKYLMYIRKDLFVIGTEAATTTRFLGRLKKRVGLKDVLLIEERIVEFEKEIKKKKPCFSVIDQGELSSLLNVARSIARKLERRGVTLSRKGILKNKQILIYLNRLSDLLFLMAECCEKA